VVVVVVENTPGQQARMRITTHQVAMLEKLAVIRIMALEVLEAMEAMVGTIPLVAQVSSVTVVSRLILTPEYTGGSARCRGAKGVRGAIIIVVTSASMVVLVVAAEITLVVEEALDTPGAVLVDGILKVAPEVAVVPILIQ
jgi:hypothetical protein